MPTFSPRSRIACADSASVIGRTAPAEQGANAVACLPIGHLFSDFDDDARDLESHPFGAACGRGVSSLPLRQIGAIECRSCDPSIKINLCKNFMATRFSILQIHRVARSTTVSVDWLTNHRNFRKGLFYPQFWMSNFEQTNIRFYHPFFFVT